jgi:hypothetical protein
MGYLTNHGFSCDDPENKDKYTFELGELSGYDDELFGDAVKWYECEEHMREFSERYPNVLFTISGYGEDPGDIWKLHAKNGKLQKCEAVIVIPPYDPERMK